MADRATPLRVESVSYGFRSGPGGKLVADKHVVLVGVDDTQLEKSFPQKGNGVPSMNLRVPVGKIREFRQAVTDQGGMVSRISGEQAQKLLGDVSGARVNSEDAVFRVRQVNQSEINVLEIVKKLNI